MAWVFWVRVGWLDFPLERDEGEYAYGAWRLLSGDPPFATAYTMKLPGTTLAYAAAFLFLGPSAEAVRLLQIALAGVQVGAVALLARRWLGPGAAGPAALAAAFLGTLPSMLGQAAHATQFVAAAGAVAVLAADLAGPRGHRGALVLSGLAAAAAFLAKQPGLLLAAAAGVWVLWPPGPETRLGAPQWSRLPWFVAGFLLPLAVLAGVTVAAGTADDLWLWAVRYALAYGGMVDPLTGARLFVSTSAPIAADVWPLLGLAAAGLFTLLCLPGPIWPRLRVPVLAAAGAAAVVPGLYFREHYFVTLLPGFALLVAAGFLGLVRASREALGSWTQPVLATLIIVPLAAGVAAKGDLYFPRDAATAARRLYGTNPFAESAAVAALIANATRPDETVAILGSEPQIPFLARRRAATGFLYVYPLMEDHPFAPGMQERMQREIEAAAPPVVVVVDVRTSWLPRATSSPALLDWWRRYQKNHYELFAVVELRPLLPAILHEIPPGAPPPVFSGESLGLWRRRVGAPGGPS